MRHLLFVLLLAGSAQLCAQGHKCNDCHTQGVSDDRALMASIHPRLPQLCINCHQQRQAEGEHRINIKPVSAHPASLPLLNGMVSCTTCHDPHGKLPAQLRMDAAKLCQDCHNK